MHEITDFLRGFPPFNSASPEILAEVESATEIEFFPAGSLILKAGEGTSEHAFVVRTGQAELVSEERVVDVLEPGDVFGLPSMLTSLPPGLDVRAAEDLLVYRIAESAMLRVLSDKAGLRFLGETVRDRSLGHGRRLNSQVVVQQLRDLVRPPVLATAEMSIAEVAALMRERESSSAVLVQDQGFAIVTDNDLRNRVLAVGRDASQTILDVVTPNAATVPDSMSADAAVIFVLAHAIRHLLVVNEAGQLLGVVEDVDLLSAQSRAPMRLRRSIAKATGVDELARICQGLMSSALASHDAGQSPESTTETYSVLAESVISRLISLRLAERGAAPAEFAWVATGSLGRFELSPDSDVDCLVAWVGNDDDAVLRKWFRDFAAAVNADIGACGLRVDAHGVRADDPRFSRSQAAWCQAITDWAADPSEGQADIYLATMLDSRAVAGDQVWQVVKSHLRKAVASAEVKAVFARVATAHRVPTGFMRDLVIEASGEHAGSLDLKAGGLAPLVDIARFLALVVNDPATSTTERLASAHRAEELLDEDFEDLREAWRLLFDLRLERQFAAHSEQRQANDYLVPAELPGLVRRRLKDALRVVARMQREIDGGTVGRRR